MGVAVKALIGCARALVAFEALQSVGRAVLDDVGVAAMRARTGIVVVRLYHGDGLAVTHQCLQGTCQLLALVVRELLQAVNHSASLDDVA
jgi:hypothetical protein